MKKNTVLIKAEYHNEIDEQINPFVGRYIKEYEFYRVGDKSMICLVYCTNGFEIRGESGCINKEDFQDHIGAKWALRDAVYKMGQIIGFHEQQKKFEGKDYETCDPNLGK